MLYTNYSRKNGLREKKKRENGENAAKWLVSGIRYINLSKQFNLMNYSEASIGFFRRNK